MQLFYYYGNNINDPVASRFWTGTGMNIDSGKLLVKKGVFFYVWILKLIWTTRKLFMDFIKFYSFLFSFLNDIFKNDGKYFFISWIVQS